VLTNAFRNFRALPFAILLIFATALPALAGPFEDAVAKFANDEFSDTEEAIGVLATGGSLEPIVVNDLGDDIYATPAISAGKIYLRTRGWLYCFGMPQ